jgi:hypothetical protein
MFLQPDWFEVLKPGVGTNRFSYSFNDPVNKLDPTGNEMEVTEKKIKVRPDDMTVPSVTLPNNQLKTTSFSTAIVVGVSRTGQPYFTESTVARRLTSYSSKDVAFWNSHQTNVYTSLGVGDRSTLEEISEALSQFATPVGGLATPDGTVNDAGDIGPIDGPNQVVSYRVPSPDPSRLSDIIVNVAKPDHTLAPGVIVRYAERSRDGTITLRTYGEGNAMKQGGLNPSVSFFNDRAWQPAHQYVLDYLGR